MNKVTTAALAGLMVVTAGAQASDARWNGFGSASAYIADAQDMFTLPGVVASHADTTYFELGANQPGAAAIAATAANNVSVANNAWGGIDSKLGNGVLGLWFNRATKTLSGVDQNYAAPDGGIGAATPLAAQLTTILNTTLHNQIDVLYGYNLSDATTLGLGLSRATNSTKTETVTTSTSSQEYDNGDFGVSLGLEQKEVGPLALLEVGLQYNALGGGFVNKATNTDKINDNASRIALRVGGDIAGKDGKFGRVELGFNTSSLDIKDDFNGGNPSNAFVESKDSGMGWNVGYAMGGSMEKGMGLMGLMLQGASTSLDEAWRGGNEVNKTDNSTIDLLATTAGEVKATNWLTFRAGMESDLFYSKTNVVEQGASGSTTKTTITNDSHAGTAVDPNAKISMGVSLNLGDLTLDGVFNQGLLYTGPYFISGIPQAYSSQVALTWPWGGSKN